MNEIVDELAALERAQRLTAMGITVRSAELAAAAATHRAFVETGGNRAMRRAAARSKRKRPR